MAEAKDSKKDVKTEAKEGKVVGGSRKKRLIIGAAVVLLAVIAGAATWYFVGHKQPPAGKNAKHVEEVEKPEEPATPIFQALEPIVVNLGDGSESVMRVAITVQLRSDKDKEKLMAYLPKVQGDLMLLFSSQTGEELLTQEGKLALIAQTKHTINRAVDGDKKLKPEEHMVKAVSFTEMIIQ